MKRYIILSAAFLMQMCLGATYSWSVFVSPIRELTGLSQGITQIPFTTFYLAFPVTLIFSGSILHSLGPRRSALVGTVLFGSGWVVAGVCGGLSFFFVVLGVGIMSGIGVGFAYIVPIQVGNRWFPRQPGLVTGFAVAGFAVGSALIGLGGETMMHGLGFTPFRTLALLGCGFLLIGAVTATQMEFPRGATSPAEPSPARWALLRNTEFRQLFPAMVAGLAAGFAVNSNLKDLCPPGHLAAGGMAVAVFAAGNAAGRIAWGVAFDRMLPSSVIRLNLFAQAVVLAVGLFVIKDLATLLIFAGVAGFNYGGVLVLYASTVARRWGLQHMGQVYGLLFTANIVAAPGAMVAGFSLDLTGSFLPAFLLISLFAAVTGMRVGDPINRELSDGRD